MKTTTTGGESRRRVSLCGSKYNARTIDFNWLFVPQQKRIAREKHESITVDSSGLAFYGVSSPVLLLVRSCVQVDFVREIISK